jgi:hypothetical protein
MNQSNAITLDAVLREAILRDIKSAPADTNTPTPQTEVTIEAVLREAFQKDAVLSEQLLTSREEDSLTNLVKQKTTFDPTKPDPNLRIFPTQMGPNSFLTKNEKEMDKIIASKKLKPWPENLAPAEQLFKTQVFRTDKLSPNNAGRLTNAAVNSYNWQVPVYAADLKSGTLFHFQSDGYVYMRPDLSTSTKFKWKLAGNKIQISNPGGQVFGYIYKKGKNLIFNLTDDVKSGEFDVYKESGWIKRFFLIAGHGLNDKNLYQRSARGFEDISDKPVSQVLDTVQSILDWAGLIPGYGDIIDFFNGIGYFIRGRKLEGCLSMIAVIPIAGSIVKLGSKRLITAVKFGGKVGPEAIQAALQSEQAFLEMWRRNARQRKNVKDFFKQFSKLATMKNLKQLMLAVARGFRATNVALSRIAEQMVVRYGDAFQAWALVNAKKSERLLKIAEEGADELFLATAVKTYSKKNKKEILLATSKFFRNTAPTVLGKVWGNVVAMLPKKVWDSVASNMVNSFTVLCKKRPEVFLASVLNTPGGRTILYKILNENKASITTWIKTATFRLPGGAINMNMIQTLGLPADLLNTGVRNVDAEIWGAISKIINSGNGAEIYKKIIVPLFSATKTIGGSVVGKEAQRLWTNQFIKETINSGNLIFVEYTKTFWARFCALLPNAIYRTYDTGKVLGLKYDWKSSGILDPLFEPAMKWLSTNGGAWLSWLFKAIEMVLYVIKRLFARPKALDVIYNEFQDLLEKTGVYTDDRDQRQGFIVSLLSWAFGSSNAMRTMYNKYVKPVIVGTVDAADKVASKTLPVYKSDPGDYDFVTRDEKGNVEKVKFATPTATNTK